MWMIKYSSQQVWTVKNYNWYVKYIYSFPDKVVVNMVCSLPFKRGEPKFWKFQKGGEPEKKFGVGETKRWRKIFKNKGGANFLSWI